MYCIYCGKKIDSDEKFCTNCGNQVTSYTNPVNVVNPVSNDTFVSRSINPAPISKIQTNSKKSKFPFFIFFLFLIPIIFVFSLSIFIFSNKERTRTIMIYMVGADLESRVGLGSRDLGDLNYQKTSNNKVKVVLIAGGSKTWHNNYVKPSETSIYELKENGFVKVKSKSLENMGKEETLSYFLNYVYQNYKSNLYDFIFWNHGGAIDGSEYDELSDNDNLKIPEMRRAFSNSPFKNSKKLEVLSFRTCLNATLELSSVLKDFTKYIVASEEITIGSNRDSALRFINDITVNDDAISYAKKEIDVYLETVANGCGVTFDKNNLDNLCFNTTYSLIDTRKIDTISRNLDSFSKDLNNIIKTNYAEIARVRTQLDSYADTEKEAYEMVDLFDLVTKYKSYSSSSDKLLKSIEDAVIINKTNNNYSHGLSIYYPFYNGYFLKTYSDLVPSHNYYQFASNFFQYKKTNGEKSFNNFSNPINTFKEDNKKVDFYMELSEEQEKNLAISDCLVFADMKDGTYKLVYDSKSTFVDDHKLKVNFKDKLLKISDIEYEDESQWLTLLEVDDNTVETYVILRNNVFESIIAKLVIQIDDKYPNGKIVSISTDDDYPLDAMKLVSRRTVELSDYLKIVSTTDSYKITDDSGVFNPNFLDTGKKIYTGYSFFTDEFKLIRESFNDDYDFYAVFRIVDIYGNTYYSKLGKIK